MGGNEVQSLENEAEEDLHNIVSSLERKKREFNLTLWMQTSLGVHIRPVFGQNCC